MSITTRCVASDVQKILSATGVALRVDDDPSALQWAREEAGLIIDQYCLKMYSAAQLAQSNWVIRKEAWIAAYKLCQRRNNPVPDMLVDEVDGNERREGLMKTLERIYEGTMKIPDAQPRKGDVPVLSNMRERLRPFPQPVVVTGTSTGTPQGYPQHTDTSDWYTYDI